MKFGIIGTGAVGGYYGGLLCRQGFETHFLLHSDYEHVMKNGLFIESKDGDFALGNVNAYSSPEDMPRCDIVLVALKTTANDSLASILPHVAKDDSIVVVLQNGLGVEADVRKVLPGATILGGLCFLCSNKIGPGHIRHLDFGSVRLGEFRDDGTAAGITPALDKVSRAFSQAGIPVDVTENLGLARWQKLVWNMAFNGVSVVLSATTRELMDDASSLSLVRDIMREVVEGARACGYDPGDNFIETMLDVTGKMVAYSPSMKLDFEAGRPLETDKIYRAPIMAARVAGFNMLKSEVIARQLEFLDRRNTRNAF